MVMFSSVENHLNVFSVFVALERALCIHRVQHAAHHNTNHLRSIQASETHTLPEVFMDRSSPQSAPQHPADS